METSIDKLTAAMAAGEPAAIERFYRAYFDRLYVWARKTTRRDESFCLDVVQEAVLKVVRTVRPVESAAQLESWLLLVVRTTAYDLLKSERRRLKRQSAVAIPAGSVADDEPPPIDDEDRLDWLKKELDAMDPQIVRLIEMRYRNEWTLQRIGAALGLTAGTVDGRLRRAIAALRRRAGESLE